MATDLERLIVSIEANTKQFQNAMRSLEKTTDVAMAGVERSVRASSARQAVLFGESGRHAAREFTKEFTQGIGLRGVARGGLAGLAGVLLGDFIGQAIKTAAEAGDESAKAFLDQWKAIKTEFSTAVADPIIASIRAIGRAYAASGLGGAFVDDLATAADTEAKRLEIERRRTTVLTKNVQLTEQETNLLDKQDKLGFKEPAKLPAIPSLGPLQAPGAEQLEAFDKVMKNLIFEEQQLGRTAEMQRVYNELKKAGVNIESEYGQAIQITAQRLHEEELQLQAVKEVNDGLEASTKTFIQGLLDGQSAAEAFNAALRKMADALLDLALHSLFNPGGTPLLQSLFGNLLGLGQWTGGVLPGSGGGGAGAGAAVSNMSLGGSGRGGPMGAQFHTAINVQGSVDSKTLGAMDAMIRRNNVRQNAELQRTWGNMQSRYAALRGP